jgi:hypothetical protein
MERPAPVSPVLRAAIERAFPESERERAIAALESVSDSERVLVAVVVLAAGDGATAAAVERYAMAARVDWRDVLYWAEYHPEQVDYDAAVRALGLPNLSPERRRRRGSG